MQMLLNMGFFCIQTFWIFLSEIKISASDEITLNGYTGHGICISCYHMFAQNNRKYFCRDPCRERNVLVSSDRPSHGRFTSKDFKTGLFTVNITDLQESDSGTYWCGVDRVGIDTYHKLELRVYKSNTHTTTVSEIQLTTLRDSVSTSSTGETSTFTPLITGVVKTSSTLDAFIGKVPVYSVLYAVMGLVAMVTALAFGLICVCLYKKRLQTSARSVSRTSTHIDSQYNSEESNTVYENDLEFENPEDSIYQNICVTVNTSQADAIYISI